MKYLNSFKTFESNQDEGWKKEYAAWCDENKGDQEIQKMIHTEPHYAMDAFKRKLESEKKWNNAWDKSFNADRNAAQEQYLSDYQGYH
jgi:hypothetical protein